MVPELFSTRDQDVGFVQIDTPPFLVSRIRFGGYASPDLHGITDKIPFASREGVHDAVPGAQEADQQEDTPTDGEPGQCCPQFVVGDGAPYFFE